jgi:biofilm PGA synthesis N-glycosyltransferase PgaC
VEIDVEAQANGGTRYIIITPVRNEGKRFQETAMWITTQTLRPVQWIIVDDGSSDGTETIADRYSSQYSWISVVHRSDRGSRQPGAGVIEAFYEGYESLTVRDWAYLVKLDGDLSAAPDYFERCLNEFQESPQLGIGGGLVSEPNQISELVCPHPMFHVRGATKIYRRACWDSIGGLLKAPGWDTLDEVKANMLGWETRTFLNIPVRQLKATGSADGSWNDAVKNGLANYISGYHPLFLIAKCLRRIGRQPYLLGASGILYGYITGYLKRIPRVKDRALIHYLRKQQLRRLVGRSSIWT